jgi:hypothetical protein
VSTTSSGISWDERYAGEEYGFGTAPNDFLRECMALPAFADAALQVLCIGDGEGRNGVWLAGLGHEVTSVDLSPVGVDKARRLATVHRVPLDARVGDLARWDLGVDAWDLVVSVFCHLAPELRADVHARIARAVRPRGWVAFEAYRPANVGRGVGGPQSAELNVTLEELRGQFAGWEPVVAREVERDIHEGRYHNGMSATTQWLARRPGATGGAPARGAARS